MPSNEPAQVSVQDQATQANAMVEPISERPVTNEVPYSVFPVWQKKVIVLGVALAAVFSPMATVGYLDPINCVPLHIGAAASDASGLYWFCQHDDVVKPFS